MRKKTPSKSTNFDSALKIALSVFVLGFLTFAVPRSAYAVTCDEELPWYRQESIMDCAIKGAFNTVEIGRTMAASISSSVVDYFSFLIFNVTPEDLGVCAVAIADEMGAFSACTLSGSSEFFEDLDEAGDAAQQIGCEFNSQDFFFAAPRRGGTQAPGKDGLKKPGGGGPGDGAPGGGDDRIIYGPNTSRKTAGSLMGLTSLAYTTAVHESPNVNLAYYGKHMAQKVPILNQTAYAQETSYPTWGLELVLLFWQKSRNIAFAMMSVIMLVIGIMIITRRKINPQTVVTVQTALPRIVISMFLIVFSYPIGAVMASMINIFSVMVLGVFFSDFVGELFNMNILVVFVGNIMFLLGGGGALGMIVGLLMGLLLLIAMIVAFIKIIFINLKILIAIMFAPLQFAIAAIPGQENLVSDWFKQMAVKVLSIPAIIFMVALAFYLLIVPVLNPGAFANSIVGCGADSIGSIPDTLSFATSAVRSVGSAGLTIIMLPLMSIMTMFAGIKMDKTIENVIMGPKRK